MTDVDSTLQDPGRADPKSAGPSPEYPQKQLQPPGSDADMTPAADHGEQSYVGLGRLKARSRSLPGGTAVSGGRLRSPSPVKARTLPSVIFQKRPTMPPKRAGGSSDQDDER
jgi:hypothetical protein